MRNYLPIKPSPSPKMMNTCQSKSAFTLIELILVIAIVAIISTLAVNKFGNISENAKKQVNIANITRVSSALETYVAASAAAEKNVSFDKLDSLTRYDASTGAAGSLGDLSKIDALLVYTNIDGNVGLSSEIARAPQNSYAGTSAGILGTYYLSQSDVSVLQKDLNLKFVMRGYPAKLNVPYYQFHGDDGSYVSGSVSNPDTCCSVVCSNAPGMAVAVVNPGATRNNTPVGPNIYRACGSDVSYSGVTYKVMVNGNDCNSNDDAFKKLMAGDGILMAFGLGGNCALVGNSTAGLDSAPVSPVMDKTEYRRYIVLIRVKYTEAAGKYTAVSAQYAGVMDPQGNTLGMLR